MGFKALLVLLVVLLERDPLVQNVLALIVQLA
jgi:hypothetical protein